MSGGSVKGTWARPHVQVAKYAAIGSVQAKTRTAYMLDFMLRQVFLTVVIFTFSQLWKATYASVQSNSIGGFTRAQMLWYLVLTESIAMGAPRAAATLDSEIKSGQLAYSLLRPYSYLLYHYASFLGEALVRVPANVFLAGIVALLTVGPITPGLDSIAAACLTFVLGITIHFLISGSIGMLAFWFEDTSSFQLLYSRVVLLLGGVLLPLELFPAVVRRIAAFFPTSLIAYEPARLFTGQMPVSGAWAVVSVQLMWIAGLSLVMMAIYRQGVKRTSVQGG